MLTVLRELYAYRVLVQTLVVRDLKGRYRGSILGLFWTLLNPLLYMGVYTLVFSNYIRVEIERYPAFLLCGLLPWIWLSSSLLMGATSIVEGGSLVKKVFLPPQVLPTVTVIVNFVNFLLGFPLLLVLLALFGVEPGWGLVGLPLITVAQFVFTLGLTLIVAAASVRYRDIPHILAHLVTFWFFLCPILYPATQVPEHFRFLVSINPFSVFVVGYQAALLDNKVLWSAMGEMILLSALALVLGMVVFGRFRWSFAEEV
jgi:ABC-type polysaccharide/polyol phosphate export permease